MHQEEHGEAQSLQVCRCWIEKLLLLYLLVMKTYSVRDDADNRVVRTEPLAFSLVKTRMLFPSGLCLCVRVRACVLKSSVYR